MQFVWVLLMSWSLWSTAAGITCCKDKMYRGSGDCSETCEGNHCWIARRNTDMNYDLYSSGCDKYELFPLECKDIPWIYVLNGTKCETLSGIAMCCCYKKECNQPPLMGGPKIQTSTAPSENKVGAVEKPESTEENEESVLLSKAWIIGLSISGGLVVIFVMFVGVVIYKKKKTKGDEVTEDSVGSSFQTAISQQPQLSVRTKDLFRSQQTQTSKSGTAKLTATDKKTKKQSRSDVKSKKPKRDSIMIR